MNIRRIPLLLLVLVACALIAAPAWASNTRTHPPGNNGTVKVDGSPFDSHPNNEPHVDCRFQIDLYGYDQGNLDASATLELWSPTGSGVLYGGSTAIGEDDAGGGTDLDAEVTVDLASGLAASGATPHPIQGYHVRLVVHAEGSIGADVKHKMLWVECGSSPSPSPTPSSPSASTTPTHTTSPSASTSPSGTSTSSQPPSATSSSTSTPVTSVEGDSGSHTATGPGARGTDRTPPAETAFTGGQIAPLAIAAIAFLVLGAGLVRLASRRAALRFPGRR
jgi:hypothetical protein